MVKKIISFKNKNNERETSKSNEVYELPIPMVDAISEITENKPKTTTIG